MPTDALSLENLLALERNGWDSLCRSEGGSFYGELMAPAALMVLVNGMVLDRTTVAKSLNDSPPWSSYVIEDARRISTSEVSAALVYKAVASRADQDEPFVALMTSHYSLLNGAPALMLYQQTTITHT